jgi:hypothetical protein
MSISGFENPRPDALPPEYAGALNAVDLRLYFGAHGALRTLPRHGPAVLMVKDYDYARAGQIVDGLEPSRGDILAHEAAGYPFDWSASAFRNALYQVAESSPYIDERLAYQMVGDSLATPPEAGDMPIDQFHHLRPEKIRAFMELARAYQVISPPEYATGLAMAKGIDCPFADASQAEMDEWNAALADMWSEFSFLTKIMLKESFVLEDAQLYFRDGRMVHRLGAIATTMTTGDPKDPPVLGFQAGSGHERGIKRILHANNISFTAINRTPEKNKRLFRDSARDFIKIAVPFINSAEQHHIEAWIASAQARASSS